MTTNNYYWICHEIIIIYLFGAKNINIVTYTFIR